MCNLQEHIERCARAKVRDELARTLALAGDEDGCFVRIDEWEAQEEWEREAQPIVAERAKAAEFTPTTEQVEQEWISAVITPSDYYDAISEDEAQARWDRWLAQVKSEAKAAGMREAAAAVKWLPYWHDGTHSEFDLGAGATHRDTVLAAIRAASETEGAK